MASWLDTAIFYQIYPQSFQDSNGDGIGDLQGIIERLDYLVKTGFNAIWLNPVFDSSFYDAGYDVRDYYRVAPRYGNNEDLRQLFREAHQRHIHVLLDLVAGHTAIDHPWFQQSAKDARNAYTDRYIWRTGGPRGDPIPGTAAWLCGISERPGAVAVNCFATQPALNYGFGTVTAPWQFAADSPEATRTREVLQDIMAFWLDLGCDGFRVDMAASLVKNDPGWKHTIQLWQKVRAFLDENYPHAVLVSEWGDPEKALQAGFHMDFLLHTGPSHYLDLFREQPYFAADGRPDLSDFTAYYLRAYTQTAEQGLICLPSGNHDMVRMRDTLTMEEMHLAFAFLLTMPGCPFVYYGDEIGLPYRHGLISKEGGYERTGSRTPMQWNSHVNAGFSSGAPDSLYLPVDTEPNVQSQLHDPNSLLHHVIALIQLREEHTALHAGAAFQLLSAGGEQPLCYLRSDAEESLAIALNPKRTPLQCTVPSLGMPLRTWGSIHTAGDTLTLDPGSYTIWSLDRKI